MWCKNSYFFELGQNIGSFASATKGMDTFLFEMSMKWMFTFKNFRIVYWHGKTHSALPLQQYFWHFPLLFRFAFNMLNSKTAPRWSSTTLCPYKMPCPTTNSQKILQLFLSLFLGQITPFTFKVVFFSGLYWGHPLSITIAVSISSPNPLTFPCHGFSIPSLTTLFPYFWLFIHFLPKTFFLAPLLLFNHYITTIANQGGQKNYFFLRRSPKTVT